MTGGRRVRIRDLGPIVVELDGVAHAPGGAVLERMLARLLVDHDRRVDPAALAEAVWGDRGAARSSSTLDSHLWRLRRLLEPHRSRGAAPEVLLHDAGGYRLAVPDDRVDSLQFVALATTAASHLEAGQPDLALRDAEQARALWRGRPLTPWSDEDWAAAPVARLEELDRQLGDTLIEALLALGRYSGALAELEPVLAGSPLRERPWEQRMRAASGAGRIDEALATYRRAARLFRDELGVEPSERLRACHARLLHGAPAVPPAPAQRAPSPPVDLHLPRLRHRLVGRGREVRDLDRRLSAGRLVTVVGGAGCGKTALALAAAHEVAGRFPDCVWFVDLSGAADARQLGGVVTSALGVSGEGTGTTADVLRTGTRDRRMLVVLDNCEHVLDAVAELVEQVLSADGDLVVLATSREPLAVADEDVVVLGPLAVVGSGRGTPPAVELFLERLADVDRDRVLGPEERRLAATICTELDGVPLAIELAAARGRAFGLDEIAAQVRADPSALARIGRGRSTHLTVRAAVDRSFSLLAEDERSVHTAVSAIPGPFTLRLAAAVTGRPGPETTDLVAGLVHRSLLVADGPQRTEGPSRFHQLAIVRAHAGHVLDAAASERVADRRDRAIVDAVVARPRMGMSGEAEFHDAMDDDLPALRATLQNTLVDRPSWGGPALAAGLGMYWYYRGMLVEGGRWIEAAFASLHLARPVDAAVLHSNVLAMLLMERRSDEGRPHLDALLAAADAATGEDLLWIGDELAGLTGPALLARDPELVELFVDRARQVAAVTGDPNSEVVARVAALKSRAATPPGQLAEAADVHAAARTGGNRWAACAAAMEAVHACLLVDDVPSALRWSGQAVADDRALGTRENPTLVELHASLSARLGDDVTAVRWFSAAKAQNQRAGMRWPVRPDTPALLDRAAGRLGPEQFQRSWESGRALRLADLVGGTPGEPDVPDTEPQRPSVAVVLPVPAGDPDPLRQQRAPAGGP